MNKLLLSTVGVILSAVAPALALPCTVSGVDVTCDGAVDVAFWDNTDGLRVTVTPGSSVTSPASDAFRIRGIGNEVYNQGTITGGGDGIDGGEDLYVENDGTITATFDPDGRGIDARYLDGLEVINRGEIRSNHKAIRNQDASNARIENHGLIESQTHEAIETGDNAVIVNAAGGILRGSDDAIQAGENAEITNHGLIESVLRGGDEGDPQDGIDLDSGLVTNHATGVIRSDDDAAIDFDVSALDIVSEIVNHGLVSGTIGVLTDGANTSSQRIVNHGTIVGSTGLAFDLGAGADEVKLHNGATLVGDGLFGTGDDLLALGLDVLALTADLFDGGEDVDTVSLLGFSFTDISAVSLTNEVMNLSLDTGAANLYLLLTAWESFEFADGDYGWDEVAALAPVPTPAGLLLLATALAGLVFVRRRAA